jgi:hypothetical protein
MYVSPNFQSKKKFREAVAAGERVRVFSPGPFPAPENGEASIEGPHYPEPHKWYARVKVVNGCVEKVIS